MSDAPAATEVRRAQRFDLDALPPWRTAAVLGASLLGLLLGVEIAAGRLGAGLPDELVVRLRREVAIDVLLSLCVAYLAGALLSLRGSARRNVARLAPLLDLDAAALREIAVRAARPGPRSRTAGPIFGVVLVVSLASLVNPRGVADWLEPGYWIVEAYWAWAAMLVFGLGVGLFTTTSIHASLTFRTLAARVTEVDLLDPTPLAPFVRQGMQTALLWLGLLAILALNLVNQDFGTTVTGALAFAVAVSTASLFLPLSGIRARLRERKAEELGAVRAEIRRARDGLGTDAVTRLPGLLAYEQRVLDTREWLLDAPTVVRFLLYLAIPLASWLGGAFAERIVSVVLD